MAEWISVKDRLPVVKIRRSVRVMVYGDRGGGFEPQPEFARFHPTGHGDLWQGDAGHVLEVTHWQDLPDPPAP
jgi:hypothetical protein